MEGDFFSLMDLLIPGSDSLNNFDTFAAADFAGTLAGTDWAIFVCTFFVDMAYGNERIGTELQRSRQRRGCEVGTCQLIERALVHQ